MYWDYNMKGFIRGNYLFIFFSKYSFKTHWISFSSLPKIDKTRFKVLYLNYLYKETNLFKNVTQF